MAEDCNSGIIGTVGTIGEAEDVNAVDLEGEETRETDLVKTLEVGEAMGEDGQGVEGL